MEVVAKKELGGLIISAIPCYTITTSEVGTTQRSGIGILVGLRKRGADQDFILFCELLTCWSPSPRIFGLMGNDKVCI